MVALHIICVSIRCVCNLNVIGDTTTKHIVLNKARALHIVIRLRSIPTRSSKRREMATIAGQSEANIKFSVFFGQKFAAAHVFINQTGTLHIIHARIVPTCSGHNLVIIRDVILNHVTDCCNLKIIRNGSVICDIASNQTH